MPSRSPIRTDRRTKRKYPIRGATMPVEGEVEILSTGMAKGRLFKSGGEIVPWIVESRLRDGRKFTVRIQAYNQSEAGNLFRQRFPVATIMRVHREGHPTLLKIAKAIGPPGVAGN